MSIRRKLIIVVFAMPLVYVATYLLNSLAGGYWVQPVRDGKHLWPHGLSMHDAIQWQPRLGYVEKYDRDFFGIVFFPLIRLDQMHWHHTYYMTDEKDFYFVLRDMSPALVHPKFREEYRKIELSLTMRWSEADCLSRIMLAHAPRQATVSLIFDVRQKKYHVASTISGASGDTSYRLQIAEEGRP